MKKNLFQSFANSKRGFRKNLSKSEETARTSRTINKWDSSDEAYQKDGFKCYWELLEDVQRYQAEKMAGGKDIIEYLASFFPKGKELKDLNGLMIGCMYGEHTPANSFAKTGAFRKLLIVDIADGLLKRQKALTDRLGLEDILEYKSMNLNSDSIEGAEQYDFISGIGTIHHIERLEGLFSEIKDALRNDGVFCMREYVGPRHLQFTEDQINLCNRVLQGLPEHLKMDKDGKIKNKVERPSLKDVMADDPSEAVRSEDIIEIANQYLEILACNWTGGTLLHPLLDGIAGNFEKGDAERSILRTIILLEQVLIDEGIIPSDYVFLIARRI